MVLATLYSRAHLVLLSPVDFLADPMCWLRAIHRYRGALIAAPNFAYDLCVRKCSPDRLRRESIDLSCVALAGMGGEPVSMATVERFRTHFAPFGLRPEVLSACYGLAENTLVATGHRRGEPLRSLEVSAGGLQRNAIRPPASPQDRLTIVGSGRPFPGSQVRIAGEDGRVLAEREVGEIQVKGASVAAGYFADDAATRESFVGPDDDRWLRTGDLGFLHSGDLFVCDRRKDLIIVRGQNYYPSDLEATAGRIAGIRPGSVIALSLGGGATASERPVVVAEWDPARRRTEPEIRADVMAAVSRDHGLALHEVILLPKGSIPKTSSGKLQRGAMKEALKRGDLSAFASRGRLGSTWIKLRVLTRIAALEVRHAPARWVSRLRGRAPDTGPPPLPRQRQPVSAARRAPDGAVLAELREAIPSERTQIATRHLIAWILEIHPEADPARIDPGRPLEELGVESVHLVEIHDRLRRTLGYAGPLAELYRFPTLTDVARHLVADSLGLEVGRVGERCGARAPHPAAAGRDGDADTEGLSDERVAELLRGELREIRAERAGTGRRAAE
jgi:hypothetical protein